MAKKSNTHCDNVEKYTDIEFTLYCESLEQQYQEATEQDIFKVLEILELDEEHSDKHIVAAVNYFKKHHGVIKNDAPLDFLTEREKNIIHQECNIRSGLYCMLLSQKFADGMSNKSLFMKHSFKYAFDK